MCVYVCVCVFNVISISAKKSFKCNLFLNFHHKKLYAPHLQFVRATCFTQHFKFYLTIRRLLRTMKPQSISLCKLRPSSFTSSVSKIYKIIFSGIILHFLIFNLLQKFSEQMFLLQDVCELQ